MFADGIIEGSSTTGTGTYTLTGAEGSALTFAQAFPSGGEIGYFAQTADRSKWEFGTGVLTVGPPRTLTRASIKKSSNGGSAVDWQANDEYYVFSIASADVMAGLMAGSLATSKPWWVRAGGRWFDYTAGLAVKWIDYLFDGADSIRVGAYDAVKALYFADLRRSSSAIGAAGRTFDADDIGGAFTFDTTAAPRTATLPVGADVGDGYSLEMFGLSSANGIVLTPDAADSIDDGSDGDTKTVPGGILFTVRWSDADDRWVTSYTEPDPAIYPVGTITGLTYANNGTDATNDIDIAAGGAMDATGAYWMALVGALTKRLDAAWAVGTNQGGLDTGSIADTNYYIWLIARSDTGVVDVLFSTSATAPTMPTNYDYKRLIGWFKRASSAIVAFKTYELTGGGLEFAWSAPTLDVNLANTLTTSRRTDALKVPLNFSVVADINVRTYDASANYVVNICCPDQTDAAPSLTAAPLATVGNVATMAPQHSWNMKVRTSATGTIAARSDLATVDLYAVATLGFSWSRR